MYVDGRLGDMEILLQMKEWSSNEAEGSMEVLVIDGETENVHFSFTKTLLAAPVFAQTGQHFGKPDTVMCSEMTKMYKYFELMRM